MTKRLYLGFLAILFAAVHVDGQSDVFRLFYRYGFNQGRIGDPQGIPSQFDIEALMCATNDFMTAELQNYTKNNAVQVYATEISWGVQDWIYNGTEPEAPRNVPVTVNFTATVATSDGSDIPSNQNLWEATKYFNYFSYIMNYLWKIPGQNFFHNAQGMWYEPFIQGPVAGQLTESSQCPGAPQVRPASPKATPPPIEQTRVPTTANPPPTGGRPMPTLSSLYPTPRPTAAQTPGTPPTETPEAAAKQQATPTPATPNPTGRPTTLPSTIPDETPYPTEPPITSPSIATPAPTERPTASLPTNPDETPKPTEPSITFLPTAAPAPTERPTTLPPTTGFPAVTPNPTIAPITSPPANPSMTPNPTEPPTDPPTAAVPETPNPTEAPIPIPLPPTKSPVTPNPTQLPTTASRTRPPETPNPTEPPISPPPTPNATEPPTTAPRTRAPVTPSPTERTGTTPMPSMRQQQQIGGGMGMFGGGGQTRPPRPSPADPARGTEVTTTTAPDPTPLPSPSPTAVRPTFGQLYPNEDRTLAPTRKEDELVYFNVQMGFFDGMGREPEADEVEAMICQTNNFFKETIVEATNDPNVVSYATNIDWEYDPDDRLPMTVYFTSHTSDGQGNVIPSADMYNYILKHADAKSLVKDFIWNSEPYPINIFYQTEDILLGGSYSGARIGRPLVPGKLARATCPT